MQSNLINGVETVSTVVEGRVRLVLMYVQMWGVDIVIEIPANPFEFKVKNLQEANGGSQASYNRMVAQIYNALLEMSERLDDGSTDDE